MTLAGERVQALHVQEDVLFSQSERRARPPSADVVVKGERARDGWIDDLRVTTRQTELGRALQQAVAVERDRVRRAVRAREEIGTPPSRAIVPDLGAVERQHHPLAAFVERLERFFQFAIGELGATPVTFMEFRRRFVTGKRDDGSGMRDEG